MDMEKFFTIHSGLPREGPGSDAVTRRAWSFLEGLPERPRILDVGCGPGKQTLALARLSRGRITALDLHQPFLDRLAAEAARLGLDDVEVMRRSMDDLPFEPASIDLVWGEGSVYSVGFKEGISHFRAFLRPGGYAALSEISWLENEVPGECRDYWDRQYAQMGTVADKAAQIEEAGYSFTGHFTLPDKAWWTEYYSRIERRIALLEKKDRSEGMAEAIAAEREEMAMHRKYSRYYGYVFYIMRKPGRPGEAPSPGGR